MSGKPNETPPEEDEDDPDDEDEDYDDYDPESEDEDDKDAPENAGEPGTKPGAPASVQPAAVATQPTATAPQGTAKMGQRTVQVVDGNDPEVSGDDILKAIQEGTAEAVERVLLSHFVPIEKALTAQNERMAELITVQNATGEGYAKLVAENEALQKSIGELHGELTLLKSVNGNLAKALGATAGGGETKPTGKVKPSDVLIKGGVAVPEGDEEEVDEAKAANEKLLSKALRLQAAGRTPDGLTAIIQKGSKPTAEDFETLRKGVEAVAK